MAMNLKEILLEGARAAKSEESLTLQSSIMRAVKERNPIMAAHIADFCWIKLGWTYGRLYEEVHKLTGIDLPSWDELLYEADRELSQG